MYCSKFDKKDALPKVTVIKLWYTNHAVVVLHCVVLWHLKTSECSVERRYNALVLAYTTCVRPSSSALDLCNCRDATLD